MPVVPFSPAGPTQLPQPDDVYVDMAAAIIEQDRKAQPKPEPKEPTK